MGRALVGLALRFSPTLSVAPLNVSPLTFLFLVKLCVSPLNFAFPPLTLRFSVGRTISYLNFAFLP